MPSWTNVVVGVITLQLAYAIYPAINRIFLTPLRHIPGPKLAALTSWYEFYFDAIQQGRFVWKIKELHLEYGPIVRITPWEVHVNDVEFLDDIYAASFRRRDKYAYQTRTLPVPLSVGGSLQHDLHRKRREALNPFFSKRSVVDLVPMISRKVDLLCRRFEDHLKSQNPVSLSDVYFAFSNDVVLQCSLGHDDNLLGNPVRASILRAHLSKLLLGVKFNQHFPWIVDVLEMLPFALVKHVMPPGVLDMKEFSNKVSKDVEQVLHDYDDARRGGKRSIFYELRDSPTLPLSEKSSLRLEHEGTLLIMAGAESTAKSIAITHFHLISNPAMMAKVRAELRTVREDASSTELEQLPYLSACIAEGNRLSFGVTARVCRIAPDEPLQYKSYTIPPGTPVSTVTLCVHTDEQIFPDPWAFSPVRWLGSEGAARRKYQMAFSRGGRNCIRINLAHAVLFLAIAAVARYELDLFETDRSDVEFRHDHHVAYPKLDSKGIRAVVRRKMAMA